LIPIRFMVATRLLQCAGQLALLGGVLALIAEAAVSASL
jgi:hypothetical protein